MMRLPYDYARCMETDANSTCPLAARCLRRLDPGRGEYQAFTAFPGGGECYGFVDAEQEGE